MGFRRRHYAQTPLGTYCLLVLSLCIGTVIIGMMDVSLVRHLLDVHRTGSFERTTGHVLQSDVVRTDGKSSSFRIDIRTGYEVDGVAHVGDRWAYSRVSFTEDEAQSLAAQYPIGKSVDIFYESSNPSDSVLSPGIHGADLLLVMIALPFNLALVVGWFAWLAERRWMQWLRAARQLKPSGDSIFVRHRWARGMYEAIGLLIFGPILLLFAVKFTAGPQVSVRVMGFVWAFLLASAASVFLWRWMTFRPDSRSTLLNSDS